MSDSLLICNIPQDSKISIKIDDQGYPQQEIKEFLDFNEKEGTTYPNVWDPMEVGVRGKFETLWASKKKLEKSPYQQFKSTPNIVGNEKKEASTLNRS